MANDRGAFKHPNMPIILQHEKPELLETFAIKVMAKHVLSPADDASHLASRCRRRRRLEVRDRFSEAIMGMFYSARLPPPIRLMQMDTHVASPR